VSHALTFKVAVALLAGRVLLSPSHSVGRYQTATTTELRFACLDLQGGVVHVGETWDEARAMAESDRRGWSAQFEPQHQHDWSAFGAARAFVAACSAEDVERALGEEPKPLHIVLSWQILDRDHNGRIRQRVARLDRMRWPGLAVWHDARGYHVMQQHDRGCGSDTLLATGFVFRSQRELFVHLHSVSQMSQEPRS
jgi:hypothetical protein